MATAVASPVLHTMGDARTADSVGAQLAAQLRTSDNAPSTASAPAMVPMSAPVPSDRGKPQPEASVAPPAVPSAGAGKAAKPPETKLIMETSGGGPSEGKEDVRIAMIGNVDSGKSTLVGCLTRAVLDDGRGSARACVFRHDHEREYGRTSSVGVELLGFAKGEQVLADNKGSRSTQWKEVAQRAQRSVTLIDLCGHEKYLKTTVFGLTGMLPDYGLVVVGANMGVSMMTKEHIGIAAALRLPMMVAVTKIDIAPKKVFKRTLSSLSRALKACGRKAFMVRSDADVATATEVMGANRITPVICLSNVTGDGMPFLKTLLRTLPVRTHKAKTTGKTDKKKKDKAAKAAEGEDAGGSAAALVPASGAGPGTVDATGATAADDKVRKKKPNGRMLIDSVFQVPGVGCVVAGMVIEGEFRANQTYMLGPDSTGLFQPVTVRSIHVHYTAVDVATAGRSAALAIRPKSKVADKRHRRTWVRKGMTIMAAELVPQAHWEFEADIAVLHHQTTLSVGYAPTMHCGVVSQTARIMEIRTKKGAPMENLRTGDRAVVRCQFMYRPEYVAPGTILLFREGRAKGVGRIKKVFANKSPTEKSLKAAQHEQARREKMAPKQG